MLMIAEQREANAHTFKLAGTLAGDWAMLFNRCWHKATRVLSPSRIVVDLTDVTFIDERGVELLILIVKAGARLVAFGVTMKSGVEDTASQSMVA